MRNRYKRSCICIAFVLVSALSLLAQSDRMEVQRGDDLQLKVSDRGRPLLTAALVEAPAIGDVSNRIRTCRTRPAPQSPTRQPPTRRLPRLLRGSLTARHRPPRVAHSGSIVAVADRNYLALTGGMFGASIANAELTIRCLQVHASCNDVPSSLTEPGRALWNRNSRRLWDCVSDLLHEEETQPHLVRPRCDCGTGANIVS